jgi:hypothetical protein
MRIAFVSFLAVVLAGCACLERESPLPITAKAPPKVAKAPTAPTPEPEPPTPSVAKTPGAGSAKLNPCDCPDDRAKDGSRCGGRSACLRENGRVPVCPGYQCW